MSEISLPRLKSRCGHGWFLLEALGGKSVSLLFSASRGGLDSLTDSSFPKFLRGLPLTGKDPWAYFGHTQLIQDNLSISRSLITSTKSFFPCKITFTDSRD